MDRIARRNLGKLLKDNRAFPGIRHILHFEGKNGPDGIKRKSPARNEPWHYFSPFDNSDDKLLDLITHHYDLLVKQLRKKDRTRSAFEAAWLAHAIVDGLTPAHHYPYEKKLQELRGGKSMASRTSIKEKMVIPGPTATTLVKNNWKMWGPRGLFTNHWKFEWGVAFIIAPLGLGDTVPTKKQIKDAKLIGHRELFKTRAREIAVLDMYDTYNDKGWTPQLAWQVRHKLAPIIVQTVCLTWYLAVLDAGLLS